MPDRKVYSVAEVAKILQTKPERIRVLVSNGYLKAFRLGKTLIRVEDLDVFLQGAVGSDFTAGYPVELKGGNSNE